MAHKCLTSPQTSFPQQNTNQTALFLTQIFRTAYIKTIICTRTSKSTDSPIPASKRSLSNPSSSCKIDFKLPLVPTTALLLSQDFFLLIRVASASAGYWRSWKNQQQAKQRLKKKKQLLRVSQNWPPPFSPNRHSHLLNSSRCLLGFPLKHFHPRSKVMSPKS
jgi:hypothetical protein